MKTLQFLTKLSAAFLIIGILFKTMHWAGGDLLILISSAGIVVFGLARVASIKASERKWFHTMQFGCLPIFGYAMYSILFPHFPMELHRIVVSFAFLLVLIVGVGELIHLRESLRFQSSSTIGQGIYLGALVVSLALLLLSLVSDKTPWFLISSALLGFFWLLLGDVFLKSKPSKPKLDDLLDDDLLDEEF